MMNVHATLLVTCPDRPGIVATVTGFLYNHGVNILYLDQHVAEAAEKDDAGTFFMRVTFETPPVEGLRSALEAAFDAVVAQRFGMSWRLAWSADVAKVALLVSKQDHALMELLWRWRRDELPCQVIAIVSNHEDAKKAARDFGLPFHFVPATPDNKDQAELRLNELVAGADLIVLARYMQVLSSDFVARFPNRIINIHHSFLPAFVGAKPYHQAHQRGVKLIGATAHYVTTELDQGPIIEQDVIRVSHRYSAAELVALGRDIERQVLARAVRWHLEHRVIVHDGKTVVFA